MPSRRKVKGPTGSESKKNVSRKKRIFPEESRVESVAPASFAQVLRALSKRKRKPADFDKWGKFFLQHAPDSVFQDRTIEELTKIVSSAYDVLKVRKPNTRTIMRSGRYLIVCQEDGQFLVRTIRDLMDQENISISLMLHPIVTVTRNSVGRLTKIGDSKTGVRESLIFLESDSAPMPIGISRKAVKVMNQVGTVVADFKEMHAKIEESRQTFLAAEKHLIKEDLEEASDFLAWLGRGNFVILGCRDYKLKSRHGAKTFGVVKGSSLGILRNEQTSRYYKSKKLDQIPKNERVELSAGPLLVLTKSNMVTAIYRDGRMDYITVKKLNERGQIIGERRFLGHYSDRANYSSKIDMPILRKKYKKIRRAFHADKGSFDDKQIVHLFSDQLLDTLFLTSADDLVREFDLAMRQLGHDEVRAAIRYDKVGRGYVVTLVMPQARYRPAMRKDVEAIVAPLVDSRHIDTRIIADSSAGGVVRVQFFFATELQSIEIKEIHKAVIETVRSWAEQVEETLIECRGQDEGQRLFNKYSDSFEDSYRALVDPAIVADDILDLESVEEDLKIRWGLADHRKDRTYLKIFSRDRKLPISEITPILVNHGFIVEEENAFCFADVPGKDEYRDIYLHVYRVKTSSRAKFIRDEMGNNICENIKNTYDNTVENDVLAGLIAITNFSSRELEILRTIRNYARQINAVPTRQSVNQALLDHPRAAGLCLRAFTGKFDPVSGSLEKFKSVKRDFKRYLSSVRSIDDDKILRVLFNIIDASVRTSFYVEDNNHRYKQGIAPIAIKVDCDRIHNMPDPRPWREIFIYGGGTLEGCHLRAGPVARGGLRWSERPDDFRTEILGLLKAQVPKNAQIVPTGAKGGFVAKNLPEDKSLWFAEVKKCYGIFISALLDIQDNLVPGSSNGRSTTTQHPENVVCYDGDDSYFVVAADKGTASFPDFANEISKYAGFWLGDAFASGGSIGYDHKKEGITARGAWVSARRNFRERSVDVDKIPITVVGVGDMSGDVFGNGMLCCKKTKLIAAFDHRHIFIDPNPDTSVSYEERKRLFRLPRSSWDNYDRKCLSKGGGIYARSQKTIKISAEAMMALGVDEKQMEPNALMCAMLRAPVDLFYNGGIGTYVKAENERNIEVGDPQNDQNRINAKELRCKVVCEGGNLGLTQAARIEFARKGGKIYADAIDNSAGVDLSDHEVNLKILLNSAVNPTEKELRQYMNRFKKEVVADVLYDSYCQTLGVSLDEIRSRSNINLFAKMISDWEKKGLIDRELEGLPDQEFMDDLAVRGEGLTKPELGVLLANAKIDAKHRLLETPVIKSKYMSQYGAFYFSPLIRKEFKKEIGSHRLKRDITATVLSNIIVNFHGATGLYQLTTELGLATSRVVEALLAAHRILDAIDIQSSLFQLDLKLPAHRQYEEHLRVDKAVRVTARWLVKNVRDLRSKLVTGLTEYNEMHKKFAPLVNKILPDKDRRIYRVGVSHLISEGIPEKLAHRLILLDYMPTLLDARKVATRKKVNIAKAAKTIYQVGDRLKMGFLITRIASLRSKTDWDHSAHDNLIVDLRASRRRIAERIFDLGTTMDKHLEKNFRSSNTISAALGRIEIENPDLLAPYIVIANQFQNLASL